MTWSTSEVAVCCCSEFAQLVEQTRVLNGDDSLRGEVLYQRDLLVGERPHFLAVDANGPDQLFVFQHGHRNKTAGTSKAHDCALRWVDAGIGDVNHLFSARKQMQATSGIAPAIGSRRRSST